MYNPEASHRHSTQKELVVKKLLAISLLFCCYPGFLSVAAQTGDKRFTLEQVMSGKFAWIQNAKGVRNVWVAESPDYHGKQITSYNQDDGENLGELLWTGDAQGVIYTRGGDLEGFGENPNSRSRPEEPNQEIWIVMLDGKPPRQLAAGHSPAISPEGDRIAFINKRDVWSTKIDGGEKPAALIQSKGRSSSLLWAPAVEASVCQ